VRTASFLALALALSCACSGRTAAQPAKGKKTPPQIYAQFRAAMDEGKFDIAGLYLDQFLKSDPTDKDLLDLEAKYGTTVFRQLRTVPRYSDDPATEKKIRADIEELNKRAGAAVTKQLYRPERVNKYIRNLGASYEEKVFAQQELKRTGEYAVPFMVEAIRQNPDPDVYAGILDTIPVLEAPTMAVWVASLDGFGPARQFGILEALSLRRDVLDLLNYAQTDFTPHLWRILAADPKATPRNLRELALALLNRFHPGIKADTKRPDAELVATATRFYNHKALYRGPKADPAGAPTVPLWVASNEGGVLKLTKLPDVPTGQADEYYGLRYARWALEANPEMGAAQSLILALAAERAVERAKFGPLAVSEPAVYRILAEAPSALLNDLLARALAEKRSALVLAMVEVLGARADRQAATPPPGPAPRPSLLVRALTYPDPAVQFHAATALLRSPVPVPLEVKPTVVDVLRRAAGTDPLAPGESKGTVLLADPGSVRSDNTALLIRGLGYTVEQFVTGRDLLRRVARSSDFDLIVIDRHTAVPELIDLVSQLDSNPQAARRPVVVVASTDRPRVPTFDQLLVRMSALIAATENDVIALPAPYAPSPLNTPEEQAALRKASQDQRDKAFRSAANARVARLQRVLDTLRLALNEEQRRLLNLRVQLIAHSVLGAEFPISKESAPETAAELDRVRRQIALQPPSAAYGKGIPSAALMRLIDRMELDVAKVKGAQEKYDFLRAHVDTVALGLTVETFRDAALEARLAKKLTNYPKVRIIPDPYSRADLEPALASLFADPTMRPRDAAVKQAEAWQAVAYLRRMALGDLPGYDLRPAAAELRAALNNPDPDVVSAAIDAVERFKTGDAQAALIRVALKDVRDRPLAVRNKAADAAVRHVRAHGKAVPANLVAQVAEQANAEPDAELRGKLLTLKGMLDFKPREFVDQLKGYAPPILPPEPKKEPGKEPEKKEPEKNP
jgi:CheY-like chemotaxis protein